MLALTALELGWPERTRELVPVLEDSGYRGYWCTEHYGHGRSASPALMAGLAGASARRGRLRIGTAAVLLRMHTPLEVACAVNLLAAHYPGRVDVGIASGLPHQPEVVAALGAVDLDGFEHRAVELRSLLRRYTAATTTAALAGPVSEPATMWVCGTSERSALLAARLGCAFAMFAGDDDVRGREQLDLYREHFVPTAAGTGPEVCVVAHGWCHPDRRQVEEFWSGVPFPARFIGSPDRCADQLLDLGERLDADHLGIVTIAPTFEDQLSSYRLLAGAVLPDRDR